MMETNPELKANIKKAYNKAWAKLSELGPHLGTSQIVSFVNPSVIRERLEGIKVKLDLDKPFAVFHVLTTEELPSWIPFLETTISEKLEIVKNKNSYRSRTEYAKLHNALEDLETIKSELANKALEVI